MSSNPSVELIRVSTINAREEEEVSPAVDVLTAVKNVHRLSISLKPGVIDTRGLTVPRSATLSDTPSYHRKHLQTPSLNQFQRRVSPYNLTPSILDAKTPNQISSALNPSPSIRARKHVPRHGQEIITVPRLHLGPSRSTEKSTSRISRDDELEEKSLVSFVLVNETTFGPGLCWLVPEEKTEEVDERLESRGAKKKSPELHGESPNLSETMPSVRSYKRTVYHGHIKKKEETIVDSKGSQSMKSPTVGSSSGSGTVVSVMTATETRVIKRQPQSLDELYE